MQLKQFLDLLLNLGRAYVLYLRELVHDVLLHVFVPPDTVLFRQAIQHESSVFAMWDAHYDGFVARLGLSPNLVN